MLVNSQNKRGTSGYQLRQLVRMMRANCRVTQSRGRRTTVCPKPKPIRGETHRIAEHARP